MDLFKKLFGKKHDEETDKIEILDENTLVITKG